MKVLFFASLSEATGCQSIDVKSVGSVESVKREIELKFPQIKNLKYIIAVNHQIVRESQLLNDSDEIAFLPPFSGG